MVAVADSASAAPHDSAMPSSSLCNTGVLLNETEGEVKTGLQLIEEEQTPLVAAVVASPFCVHACDDEASINGELARLEQLTDANVILCMAQASLETFVQSRIDSSKSLFTHDYVAK